MNETPVLRKEHARDFCLTNIESWCKGESTYPRLWTEKQQPYKPYILFEKDENTVTSYMDPRGFQWIEGEIKKQIKKDPQFVQKLVERYFEVYGRTKPIWEEEKILSYEELTEFVNNDKEGWPLYEAIYFIAELFPQDTDEFKLARKALDFTDSGGDKGDKVLRKSLEKIFPELGKLSSVLLIEEIVSKKIPPKAALEKRMKQYFYTNDTLFVDRTIADMEKMFNIKIEKNVPLEVSQLKGEIGFKGKVRGIVRKIMSYSQADSLHEGEILVTAMTTPEFLPALKKASAFITDEGGVASHAAITAREMKKPCIVGTKVATQILNTGDLIEVDAITGVVRILKK